MDSLAFSQTSRQIHFELLWGNVNILYSTFLRTLASNDRGYTTAGLLTMICVWVIAFKYMEIIALTEVPAGE